MSYLHQLIRQWVQSTSLGSPSTVHSVAGSSNLASVVSAEEGGQGSNISRDAETSRGLFLLNESLGGLLFGNATLLLDDVNLLLDKGGEDESRTDGIDGHSDLGILQSSSLGEADNAVLGGNIGRLIDRGNQTVDTGNIDDSTPSVLFHLREGVLGAVEGGAEVEGDDLFPDVFGEVLDGADVLHAGVVDQDVYLSEVSDRLLDEVLGVAGLGQVGEDELG